MKRKMLLVPAVGCLLLASPLLADELEDQYRALKSTGAEIPQWLLDELFGPNVEDGGRCYGGDTYEEAFVIPYSACGVFFDSGSTNNAANDYDFGSAPADCASDFTDLCFNGRDLVYTFTLPVATTVSASLCGETNFDSVLGIVNEDHELVAMNDDAVDCSHFSSQLESCCLSAGTYFLLVDGYRNGKGSFLLSVEFACNPCDDDPGNADCDDLEVLDVELPWNGVLDTDHAPDVFGSEAGDVAIRFTVDGSTAVELSSCLPGTEIDSDSYWFAGDSPCEGGQYLLFDEGEEDGDRSGHEDDDENEDCTRATQVLRDCGDLLPAGTYVILLSGAGDEEGAIEVALSIADCGTVGADPQPIRVELAQNSPNPFNPTTSIDFTLEQTGMVHLGVYDLLGREVAVLADGLMEAGSHQAQFDGSRLGSGVYLYTLRAEGSMVTRKMILTK